MRPMLGLVMHYFIPLRLREAACAILRGTVTTRLAHVHTSATLHSAIGTALLGAVLACSVCAKVPETSSSTLQTPPMLEPGQRAPLIAHATSNKPGKVKHASRSAKKRSGKHPIRLAALDDRDSPLMPLLSEEDAQIALEQELSLKVGKHMRADDYPHEAVRWRWTGTALVEVMVGTDGFIRSVMLSRTSGFRILDEQALAVVKRVSKLFVPLQLRNRDLKASVPVSFSLQGL